MRIDKAGNEEHIRAIELKGSLIVAHADDNAALYRDVRLDYLVGESVDDTAVFEHESRRSLALGGGAPFAPSFYGVQRTSRARLISDGAANFVFWAWQLLVVAMILSYANGLTTSKEYAEMIWPLATLLTLVWLVYAWLFFGTIARRQVRHIYVANWFYGAFIIVTGMVHVINHIDLPVTLLKSYTLNAGAADAMIQRW